MHRKCQISYLEGMSSTNQWCVPDEVQDELPVDFERSLSGLEVDLCTSTNNMNSVFAVPEISMRKEELNSNSASERCHVECYPLSIAHGKKIRYSQLTDLDCTNNVKRICFNKEVEHSESFQSGRCRPQSHSTPELRTTSSHFYSPGSVINTFLSQVVQLPVMPISQTIDQGSQGPPPLFYCILLAPTSISTKMNEDTLTYLNQGQPYEIRIKKSSSIPYEKNVLFKSIAHFGFQERRLQYMEKDQVKEWQNQRPGERILEIDVPLSYGIIEAANCSSINECEFIWDPNHDVGVFLKVNCISTEFTPKKHGGEKGVPFRILIETYVNSHHPERLHAASCQVKVFKPKGADRKHKTDREKMYKRLQNDKEKYHPQYDYTILKDLSDSWIASHSNYSTVSTGVSPIPSSPASSAPQSPPFDCLLGSPKRDCFDGPHATSTTESLEISENDSSKVTPLTFDSTSVECITWLQRNMFGNYVKDFINFTGNDILNLTRADLIDICGAANGIRLFNALHGKGCLTTYVRLPAQKAYSAIFLKSTKVIELVSKIKSFCGLPAEYNCEFYISGPSGTRVIVTDEVVSNMLQDSLFVIECVEGSSDEDCYVFLKQMN